MAFLINPEIEITIPNWPIDFVHHLTIVKPNHLTQFFSYQSDVANEPPHVHVIKEGNEVRFWLDPVRVAREGRFLKSDLRDIERIIEDNLEFLLNAWKGGKANMLTVKAKIPAHADYERILPLAVPDLKEVRNFANHLHEAVEHWHEEIFSWQAIYTPESDKKPKT